MEKVKNASEPQPSSIRLLVVGPLGVGKTTQFLTLPGKKFAYLFDPNARQSLQGHDVDYVEFVPDIQDVSLSIQTLKKDVKDKDTRRKAPQTYLNWETDFEERLEADFFKDYDWLSFDGLTTFSEIIMDRVQYLNQRLGKHPEQADYTAEMNAMKNIFRTATNIGVNLYATAHTEVHRDEEISKTYAQLVMTGRNRVRVPMRFTQIYALEAEKGAKGVQEWLCYTVPDRNHPALRTTVKNLAPVEPVNIDWAKSPIGQGLGRFVMS